jgi:hypothetical protein
MRQISAFFAAVGADFGGAVLDLGGNGICCNNACAVCPSPASAKVTAFCKISNFLNKIGVTH